MGSKKLRIVHYLNQFFGQEGGEDKADKGLMVDASLGGQKFKFKPAEFVD